MMQQIMLQPRHCMLCTAVAVALVLATPFKTVRLYMIANSGANQARNCAYLMQ
jgi:hypothetical protein